MSDQRNDEMIQGFLADADGARIKELELKLKERQDEADAQAVIVAGLQDKLNLAIRERDEATSRCDELEQELKTLSDDRTDRAVARLGADVSVIKLKEKQLRELRRELEDSQFQQRRLEANLKQLQQSSASSSESASGSKLLNDRLLEARARVTELETEAGTLKAKVDSLTVDAEKARSNLDREKKERRSQEQELRRELAGMESQLAGHPMKELRKQKNEAEEAASQLRSELGQRDEKLRDAAREQRRLEDLMRDKERENESLTQQLEQVEEKLERRKGKLRDAEIERDQAEMAYQALQEQLEGTHVRSAAEDALAGGSRSWGLGLAGLLIGALGGVAAERWLAPELQVAQTPPTEQASAPAPEPELAAEPAAPVKPLQPVPKAQPVAQPAPVPEPEMPDASPVSAAAATSPQPAESAPPAAPAPKAEITLPSLQDSLSSGGTGPIMIGLSGGGFLMGNDGDALAPEEAPSHEVQLGDFYIGQQEVTFSDYERFARATGRGLPNDSGWGRGNRPVINVTWDDAQAYAKWLSDQTGQRYRLPTEAEWEYAARAGVDTYYWWGYKPGTNNANCFNCGSRWDRAATAPVGSFAANPFGLYDTAGNVLEWVADCHHDNYAGAPSDGTAWVGGDCSQRVVRGGAFNRPVERLRSTRRGGMAHSSRLNNLGFRLVREP